MEADHRGSAGRCIGFGTLPRSFLQPCLLLILQEQPDYGYDLVIRLKALGFHGDSAGVYRALRTLEETHAVSSYWHTSSSGPARHMYRLTPSGRDQLQAAVEAAEATHRAIEHYLCRHALIDHPPPDPDDDVLAAPARPERGCDR